MLDREIMSMCEPWKCTHLSVKRLGEISFCYSSLDTVFVHDCFVFWCLNPNNAHAILQQWLFVLIKQTAFVAAEGRDESHHSILYTELCSQLASH